MKLIAFLLSIFFMTAPLSSGCSAVSHLTAYRNPDRTVDYCARVISSETTVVYYSPEVSETNVGWIFRGDRVEVFREHGNDWLYIMGYGIDAQYRKTRMTGWTPALNLIPIGCKP